MLIGAIGVIGVGFGVWWLDPLAAALVSADILKDGVSNLKTAVLDLLGRHPQKTDQSGKEPLPEEWPTRWTCVLSGRTLAAEAGSLQLAQAFAVLPVALLLAEPAG